MTNQIIWEAETFVTELFRKELTEDHVYHDLEHTLTAKKAVVVLGHKYQLPEEEIELLALAALFHDTGFTKVYDGHEEESKKIARHFLEEKGYPVEKIERVLDCIEATKMDVEPQTLLQKIMKDADFNTFGIHSYARKSEHLRHEWAVFRGLEMDEEAWLKNNIQFWKGHRFYTGEAEVLFGKAKKKNLKKLGRKYEKKKKKQKKEGKHVQSILEGNRSAQMIFKTTLRNHIDLTSIADSKANMMLSISALVITIAMPMLAGNLKGNTFLLTPMTILMITCIGTIIFATLSTRPVKTPGRTDLSKIPEGETNLFFYGNFYKMSLEEYKKGIRAVSSNDDFLDNSVVIDLFYLGKALGKKFQLLRVCYAVFMVGMTLTVLSFAIAFIYFK
ncbi:MAG: HD domain-containing protein [Bacteroidetes bacterium]|nr:MAG: HD domain-containing protein [Bacteroidota bacterium]